jgi:hypothetical protein
MRQSFVTRLESSRRRRFRPAGRGSLLQSLSGPRPWWFGPVAVVRRRLFSQPTHRQKSSGYAKHYACDCAGNGVSIGVRQGVSLRARRIGANSANGARGVTRPATLQNWFFIVLEASYVVALRREGGQFLIGHFLEFECGFPDCRQMRRSSFDINRPARFSKDRQVARIILAIRQFIGKFTQGQHRGAAQINVDHRSSAGVDSSRDPDCFSRAASCPRVARDDK